MSLDDFGTGYSSLVHLRRLPVSELKIDRSFVARLAVDTEDAEIVRCTVDLAHSLGLLVVAEGVEDDETWERLRDLGCDAVQGWLVAAAMPPRRPRRGCWPAAHGAGAAGGRPRGLAAGPPGRSPEAEMPRRSRPAAAAVRLASRVRKAAAARASRWCASRAASAPADLQAQRGEPACPGGAEKTRARV